MVISIESVRAAMFCATSNAFADSSGTRSGMLKHDEKFPINAAMRDIKGIGRAGAAESLAGG
eukprot:3474720-Pyramimonas_sp.AAC.1